MNVVESNLLMMELATSHAKLIREKFSEPVAEQMLEAINCGTTAIRLAAQEGKDWRDVLIVLTECLTEADNISTLLANQVMKDQHGGN